MILVIRFLCAVFSTAADTGEGSSTGATASGQQPVMFGGICLFV